MLRLIVVSVLLLVLAGAPLLAARLPPANAEALEAQVAEIEQLAVTGSWRASDAKIQDLTSSLDTFTPTQRHRIEFSRLRNLALAGDQSSALGGMADLLHEGLPADVRLRVYATAINVAANVEDWPLAFTWLNEALGYLDEAPVESARLLGVASYLHTLVGETDKARTLALRALGQIDIGGDPRALCVALSDMALAEDHAHNFHEAEGWRHRQIEACTQAGDTVFVANAKYGVGKMAASQGHHVEALKWAREALAEFDAAGFTAGAYSARLVIAESLMASNGQLDQVEALLTDTLKYYRAQKSDLAIAETDRLLARLAEERGNLEAALSHTKDAMSAGEAAERGSRERRLAYLQVQFDTRLKEQQIALLETEKKLAAVEATATNRRQLLLGVGIVGLLVAAVLLSILLQRSFRDRRRYRWQSEHDSLTGLFNYQQVRKLGEEALARARATGRPFSAIVADIDSFKHVNDSNGHAAGDAALRSLGAWIRETVCGWGIAGRSGGDEFTMLVEADAEQAEALVQRLRSRIEPITVFGHTFRFTVSSGICQADGEATTLEQLIHQADLALYKAKRDGRDRVVRVGSETTASAPTIGGLVVVGSGIQFGRHASERCLSEIREADVVFCLADAFALGMIYRLRPDVINLGTRYAPGKDRRETYREIHAAIMIELHTGKRVCAVFYGHPGVFADVPHRVVRQARAEGIQARMEPGISAEACLYADLGIDPGHRGVQSIEATHFLVYDRHPDTAGVVLLWQVALSGDLTCTRLHAERDGLQALVDKLLRWYPPEHEVILYEAARLPIETARAEHLFLRDLPAAHYEEYTTLVIPPLGELADDPDRMLGVSQGQDNPCLA